MNGTPKNGTGPGGERDPLLDLVRETVSTEEPGWQRPSEQAIAAYVLGEADDAQTEEVQRALATSPSFRRDFGEIADDLRSLEAELGGERRVAEVVEIPAALSVRPHRPFWRRALPYAAGIAAALVVAAILWPDRPDVQFGRPYAAMVPRDGGEIPIDPAWPMRMPVGEVSSVTWFAWDEVKGAASYDLRVEGPEARAVFAPSGLSKHYTKLPRSKAGELSKGVEYVWTVDARDTSGQVLTRGRATFTIVGK